MNIEALKARVASRRRELKDLYDEAESLSAKVKLWLSMHKKLLAWMGFSHFVVLMIGIAL